MLDTLDRMYLKWKYKAEAFWKGLKEDEAGVSAFVATILLVLVAVLLCAIFWENISEWFTKTWENITGEAEKIKR